VALPGQLKTGKLPQRHNGTKKKINNFFVSWWQKHNDTLSGPVFSESILVNVVDLTDAAKSAIAENLSTN